MYIGICEDNKTQMEYLNHEIKKYYLKKNDKLIIENFESAEELLFKYPQNMPFQCLILDIKMKQIDGMELAKKVREKDKSINIIFITGDKDYVFDGYKVGAARYILKPIKINDLIEALEYVERGIKEINVKEEYFCFNYSGEYIKVEKPSILYIEVNGHYITIKTIQNDYTYKGTMKEIINELSDERFVMVNRSELVNLDNVERITKGECLLKNGYKPVVGRNRYNELNQRFINYYK